MSYHDEFIAYLRNCTDTQVKGVWEKERRASRDAFRALAQMEAAARGITLTEPVDDEKEESDDD